MRFVPIYIVILGFTIVVDYFAGIFIEKAEKPSYRKMLLMVSVITNTGVLAVFKYFNFLNRNTGILLQKFSYHDPVPFLKILLPIGLSFHTFQALSYTIEVYRGNQKAEKHFGFYSLYVMFYPQLVAGPIERPQNILPQIRAKHPFNYSLMVSGLKLMLWGFFKKLVIADRLSIYVNMVYNHPKSHNGSEVAVASIFFAIQIYCDFSGYTDIAIGCAKTMGFRFMKNFNRPYFATNIQEFWRRWHMSLSTWFRDYVYIPLGGSRVSTGRMFLNLFIVFLLSGLWHGAGGTYIIWGLLNGSYYVIYMLIKPYLPKEPGNEIAATLLRTGNIILTFTLVTFAWIFFRANSVKEAFTLIRKLKSFGSTPIYGAGLSSLAHCLIPIAILFLVEYKMEYFPQKLRLSGQSVFVRWGFVMLMVFMILILGVFNGPRFIYFEF